MTRDTLAKLPNMFSSWGGGSVVPPEFDVEEAAMAFVRFENGATLILEVSWLLHHNTQGRSEDMQMWLYGTKAGSLWPANEFATADLGTRQLIDSKLLNAEGGEPHAKECVAFAKAIVDGAPSPVPAEESMVVCQILDGLYRSAAAGKEITIK